MNTLLLEHFDQLISTPEDVEKVNRSILQLAMQGKLVEQDPNDEPAFIALQKSCSELSQMSSGIRRGKWVNSAKVENHEEPFSLPIGWTWARVNDTGFYINGLAFKPIDWKTEGIPIIRIQNLTDPNNKFNYADGPFDDDVMVKKGDILVSWSATLETFWWDREDAVLNQHIFRVVPAEILVEKRFLFYLLRQAIRDMAESVIAHGLVMSHINKGPFLSHIVAIPPINEQRRIVNKLEKIFTQTSLLAEQLAHSRTELDRLNESALAHLLASETSEEFNERWCFIADHFDLLTSAPEHIAPLRQFILELAVRGKLTRREAGDEPAGELLKRIKAERGDKAKPLPAIKDNDKPFDLPEGWEWCLAGDLLTFVTSGSRGWAKYYSTEGPIYLRIGNLDYESIDLDLRSIQRVQPPQTVERERIRVQPGDILISMTGDVGMTAVVKDGELDEAYVNQHIGINRPSKEILPAFLAYVYISPHGLSQLFKSRKGIKNSLALDDMKFVVVALPPLAEQERIVKRVEQLLGWCDALDAQLKFAEEERGQLVESVLVTAGGRDGE